MEGLITTLVAGGPTVIVLAGFIGLVGAIVKRVFVPGWLYDQERARADAAEAREASLLASLTRLTKTINARKATPRA
jgi:hypothetical protein